ncbi:MAG: Unknown protein, partial [uncultured Thiotrichaceae bacterium]
MNKHYHQLTLEQRYQIWSLRDTGKTQQAIADIIEVHKSTICRELKRNSTGSGYRPKAAEKLSKSRQCNAHKASK